MGSLSQRSQEIIEANTTEDARERDKLKSQTEVINEKIHKECVTVYRNLQAVIVEENKKQTENIKENINTSISDLKKKLRIAYGISAVALVIAAGSILLQILSNL